MALLHKNSDNQVFVVIHVGHTTYRYRGVFVRKEVARDIVLRHKEVLM